MTEIEVPTQPDDILQQFHALIQVGRRCYVDLAVVAHKIDQTQAWKQEADSKEVWIAEFCPFNRSDFYRLVQLGRTISCLPDDAYEDLRSISGKRIKGILPHVQFDDDGQVSNEKEVKDLIHKAKELSDDHWQETVAELKESSKLPSRDLLISPGSEVYATFPGGEECVGSIRRVSTSPGGDSHVLVVSVDSRALNRDKVSISFWTKHATKSVKEES